MFGIFTVLLFMLIYLSYALSISNVEVKEVSDRYAIITFQTDEEATPAAEYGKDKSSLTGSGILLTDANVKEHKIMLSPLDSDTEYFFNATAETEDGDEAIVGDLGFNTTVTDNIKPFIDIVIPEFWKDPMDFRLSGTTEPNTEIYVRIEGELDPAGFTVTGDDGKFTLFAMVLSAEGEEKLIENDVKVIAKDPSDNENFVEKKVYVDETPPDITFELPEVMKNAKDVVDTEYGNVKYFAWGESSITIKGDSDEPAEMSVYLYPGNKLLETINISSSWELKPIQFDEEVKKYALKFTAVDRAGNPFERWYVVDVDKRELILLEHNLGKIKDSYVVHRTVRGNVSKGGATVIVLVNNKSTEDAVQLLISKTSAPVMKNIPLSISEAYDRFRQRFDFLTVSFSEYTIKKPISFATTFAGGRKAKDLSYVTTSGEDGRFEVDIELTTEFKLSSKDAESLEFETGDAWKNTVEIVVIDAVGRTDGAVEDIYYSRCGAGGYFTISAPIASPTSIPEPILKQGYGMFSLTMDLSWHGPTPVDDVEWSANPIIRRQTNLAREDIEGRYNLTFGDNPIFKSADFYPDNFLPQTEKMFALVTLNPTSHDFGERLTVAEFFAELEFPLMVELEYTYEKPGGGRETMTQRKCIDVNIQVEPAIELDRGDAKKFLLKSSQALAKAAENIDKILNYVKPAQQFALVGCGVGIVVQYLKLAVNKMTCKGKDIRDALKDGTCAISYGADGKLECSGAKCGAGGELATCCGATLDSLATQKWLVNLPCDRIFCPSVPSLPQHAKTYSDLIVKKPGKTSPQEAKGAGEVISWPGNAATQCRQYFLGIPMGGVAPAGEKQPCEIEFQRAWGMVDLLNWPYKNEYDMAARALDKAAGKTTKLNEAFIRISEFSADLCSAQDPNKVKIVSTSSTRQKEEKAFMIYRKAPDPGISLKPEEAKLTVDYGEYMRTTAEEFTYDPATGELTSKKTAKKEKATEVNAETKTYFKTIYPDLKINEEGCCIDDNCKSVASGLAIGQLKPNVCYKLPNDVLLAVASQYSDKYVFSPTSGIVSATKAACFPAITGYLTSYRNILYAVSKCFEDIALTGKGSSGACNALMSEVVCDFTIDAIMCMGRTFNAYVRNPGILGGEIGSTINPFKSLSLASSSITETISGRYGETASYKTLFSENALLHAACVGAFTGDWDFEGISNLLTEATAVPVKSVCAVFPANRRFITSNPLKEGKTTYMYYVGGLLSAGADISSLRMELVCSNDNSCTRYPTNPRGECDCFGLSESKTTQVPFAVSSRRQGEIFDDAHYLPMPDREYRYDKARIVYTYRDEKGEEKTEQCQAQLKEDGYIPPTCRYIPLLGFRCEWQIAQTGTARFIEEPRIKLADEGVYYTGQRLDLNSRIEVLSPEPEQPIPKYVRYVTRNQHGVVINDFYKDLEEGVHDYTTHPGFMIERKYFLRKDMIDTIDVNVINNPTNVLVVRDSKTAAVNAIPGEFVVTFPTENSYLCHRIEITKEGRKIAPSSGAKPFSETEHINCNGVQFRIQGQDKIKKGTVGDGTLFPKYDGTAFLVEYKQGAATISSADCTNEPVKWTVEATLHHSENREFSKTPVYGKDGPERTKPPVTVMVVCERAEKAPEAVTEFRVDKFDIPSSVKLDEAVSVDYNIQAAKTIESIGLEISYKYKVDSEEKTSIHKIDMGTTDLYGSQPVKISVKLEEAIGKDENIKEVQADARLVINNKFYGPIKKLMLKK